MKILAVIATFGSILQLFNVSFIKLLSYIIMFIATQMYINYMATLSHVVKLLISAAAGTS